VHDLDRAIAFYRDTLGMTYLFQARQHGLFRLRRNSFDAGVPERPTSIIRRRSFTTSDDIEKVYDILQRARSRVCRQAAPGRAHADYDLWLG